MPTTTQRSSTRQLSNTSPSFSSLASDVLESVVSGMTGRFGRLFVLPLLLAQEVFGGLANPSNRRLSDDPSPYRYGSYNHSMVANDVYTQKFYGDAEGEQTGVSMAPFGGGFITSGYGYPSGTDSVGRVYGYFGDGTEGATLELDGVNADTFLVDNDDGGSIDYFGISLKQITVNSDSDCVAIAADASSEYAAGSGKVSIFCDVSTDTQQLSSADPFAEFYGPSGGSFGICLDADNNYIYVGDARGISTTDDILHRFLIPTTSVFSVVTAASGYCAITDSTAVNFAPGIKVSSSFDSGSGEEKTIAIVEGTDEEGNAQVLLVTPGEDFCSSGAEDVSSIDKKTITGLDNSDHVNFGDLNCDGKKDLIIGSNDYSKVTVIFGGQTLPDSIDISDNSLDKSEIQGPIDGSFNGFGRATDAGDIDGNGCDDLIIGAPLLRANNQYYAGAFVAIKCPMSFSFMNIATDCDGYSCVWVTGNQYGQQLGQSVLIAENSTVFAGASGATVNNPGDGAVYRIPITFSELTDPPTASPTAFPTPVPTPVPTNSPTPIPSTSPTHSPTFSPSLSPTGSPSSSPTTSPSKSPTPIPSTSSPTSSPTRTPTSVPTPVPSVSETHSPSPSPTSGSTSTPSSSPTGTPTSVPTPVSSVSETHSPSSSPTSGSTSVPSSNPTTETPTGSPTNMPTPVPTHSPTSRPSPNPSSNPTTRTPTGRETHQPTLSPSPSSTDEGVTGQPTPVPTPLSTHLLSNSTNPTPKPFFSSTAAFAVFATGGVGLFGAAALLVFCFIRRNNDNKKTKAQPTGGIRYNGDLELGSAKNPHLSQSRLTLYGTSKKSEDSPTHSDTSSSSTPSFHG